MGQKRKEGNKIGERLSIDEQHQKNGKDDRVFETSANQEGG